MKKVHKEDRAVSEIIGAILLFAIASVLLSSFILWYVPSTGTNNDLSYQGRTQSSFLSLDSKITASNMKVGDSLSQTFPLGIGGTPPFIPDKSTNLYYSNNFKTNLSYALQINYTHSTNNKELSTAACANASVSNIINNNYVDSLFKYNINFEETGLEKGYYWTVQIGGIQKSSSISSSSQNMISFSFSKGSYSYKVTSDNENCREDPSTGIVSVNNAGSTVDVSFSRNINQTIVAEDCSSDSNINSVNIQHIDTNGTSTYVSGNYPSTTHSCFTNWLGNCSGSMIKGNEVYYRLASQQFTVGCDYMPVNFIEFYVEPNKEYGTQYFQGGSSIFVNIGKGQWSGQISGSGVYANISKNIKGSCYSSTGLLEKAFLKNCILLGTERPYERTYYLNFWEGVNESTSSKATPEHTFMIKFNNTKRGYGYGPNEFVATADYHSANIGTGISLRYGSEIKCNQVITGNESTNQSLPPRYVCFCEESNKLYDCNNPYFYKIGFNPTCGTNNLCVKETGLSQNKLSNKPFTICLGDTSYSISSTSFIIKNLGNFEYNYNVSAYSNDVPSHQNGFICITNGKNSINIIFNNPIRSTPNYWAISDIGIQSFNLRQVAKVNYISLYLYNYSMEPASSQGNHNLTDYIKISIYNTNIGKSLFQESEIVKVNNTGYKKIFLNSERSSGYFSLNPGKYYISIEEVNKTGITSNSGTIGWGFAPTGGYDNYIQSVLPDKLYTSINNSIQSTITPYYASSPVFCTVYNQSYIYSIGYCNLSNTHNNESLNISNSELVRGSINSVGQTSFTLNENYAFQDGVIIIAGKGLSYATVANLPINIMNANSGLSMSSVTYNLLMKKGISSSVSGTGSTLLSLNMVSDYNLNYTVGHIYKIKGHNVEVTGINLKSYSYIITSQYSKYWADTLFEEMSNKKGNISFFKVLNDLNFNLLGNSENVELIPRQLTLHSINIEQKCLSINSM
jgi:hypothetical protein